MDYQPWRLGRSWVTRDGTIIPVVALSDGHLLNIVRMLARAWPAISRRHGLKPGELVGSIIPGGDDELGLFAAVLAEFKRRGLDEHAPGAGGGVMPRKDVFDVIPEPLELPPPPPCWCRSWLGRPNYHGFWPEPCRVCGGRAPKESPVSEETPRDIG